jgi:hypothetical protein
MNETVKCEGAVVLLRKDGIVEVRVANDYVCTVESERAVTNAIASLGNGSPSLVLRITGENTSIESGVRAFLASDEAQQNLIADAIVVSSLPQRVLWNFYLRINRPKKPARIFNTEKEAVDWLLRFAPGLN